MLSTTAEIFIVKEMTEEKQLHRTQTKGEGTKQRKKVTR